MGRRNKNSTGRRPQAYRHPDGTAFKRTANHRVPIEQMVMPVGRCGRKLTFTETEVKKALEQAQHNHRVSGSTKVEKRYYQCDRCDGFHLTSHAEAPEKRR